MTFIASAPGVHRSKVWGVRALGAALRLKNHGEVDVMVPTVGEWRSEQLAEWARTVGTVPKRLRLVWVRKDHQWAKQWVLPTSTAAVLKKLGVPLLELGDRTGDDRERIHRRFSPNDVRWPHAKVYWFQRGGSARVLITSANWSPSAWGFLTPKNLLHIRNFELGVLLATAGRPLSLLPQMTAAPATSDVDPEYHAPSFWAHATFDGRSLVVQITRHVIGPDQLQLMDARGRHRIVRATWRAVEDLQQAVIKITSEPLCTVILRLNREEHWLSVQDLRSSDEALDRVVSIYSDDGWR